MNSRKNTKKFNKKQDDSFDDEIEEEEVQEEIEDIQDEQDEQGEDEDDDNSNSISVSLSLDFGEDEERNDDEFGIDSDNEIDVNAQSKQENKSFFDDSEISFQSIQSLQQPVEKKKRKQNKTTNYTDEDFKQDLKDEAHKQFESRQYIPPTIIQVQTRQELIKYFGTARLSVHELTKIFALNKGSHDPSQILFARTQEGTLQRKIFTIPLMLFSNLNQLFQNQLFNFRKLGWKQDDVDKFTSNIKTQSELVDIFTQ